MKTIRIPPSPSAVGLVLGGLLLFGLLGVLVAVLGRSVIGALLAVLSLGMAGIFVYGYAFGGMGTYLSQDGVETRSAFGKAQRVPWDDIERIDVVWRGSSAKTEFTRIVYGRGAEILFGPVQRDRSAPAFAAYLEECKEKHSNAPTP